MRREMDRQDIADLVSRAERVKRNRETVLRTFQPKLLTAPVSPSAALAPGGQLAVCLLVADADRD